MSFHCVEQKTKLVEIVKCFKRKMNVSVLQRNKKKKKNRIVEGNREVKSYNAYVGHMCKNDIC